MRSGQYSKGLEAQSIRDIQRPCIPSLNDPEENPVVPLDERHLKSSPQKLPVKRPVGGDVETAARILVMVVANCGDDLAINDSGDPTEVFNPDEPRALRDPSMDLAMPE